MDSYLQQRIEELVRYHAEVAPVKYEFIRWRIGGARHDHDEEALAFLREWEQRGGIRLSGLGTKRSPLMIALKY